MKKLTAISILLVLLSVTAFAQLKVGVDANFSTDAVFFQQAQGDMAEADTVKGATDIFSHGDAGLSLTATYTLPNAEASIQIVFDDFLGRGKTGGLLAGFNTSWLNAPTIGDYYVKGNAWVFEGYMGNTGMGGIVNDYEFTNDAFINNALGGFGAVKFPGFASIIRGDDFVKSGKSYKAMAGGDTTGTNDLQIGDSVLALGLNLNAISIPIKIEVGSSGNFYGWENNMPLNSKGASPNIPATSADSIAAAFRVSGVKIADFISFDVIYRIAGLDDNTRLTHNNKNLWTKAAITDPLQQNEKFDGGWWENEIGAYVGLDIFKGLALGVGYTASFAVDEKSRVGGYDDATIEYVNPLFSGIDLRVKFDAIDKLGITLANNLSFAAQRGENRDVMTTGGRYIQPMGIYIGSWGDTTMSAGTRQGGSKDGMLGFTGYYTGGGSEYELQDTNMWNTDQKDSWFALHNNLGVTYGITDRASVALAVGNRLGIYEFVANPDKEFAKWTTDDFEIGVSGTYKFAPNVTFEAGLNVGVWGMTAEITTTNKGTLPPTLTTGKIGEVTLAVPLKFSVSW